MLEKITDTVRQALMLDTGIHIDGNRELIIENCRRIEEYNEVFMQLLSGKLRIRIWGSGLRAFDYKTHGLVIRGRISQIELIERRPSPNEKSASGQR